MSNATIENAPATLDANLSANAETFGAQYGRDDIGRQRRDEEMYHEIKGLNYALFMAYRDAFVKGATLQGYTAPSELWERTIKRIDRDFEEFKRPKAETPKAKQMSEARAKAAEQVEQYIVSKGLDSPAKIMDAVKAGNLTSALEKGLFAKAQAMKREEAQETKKQDTETAKRIVSDVKKAPVTVLKPLQVLSTWDADILEWIAANPETIRRLATRKAK